MPPESNKEEGVTLDMLATMIKAGFDDVHSESADVRTELATMGAELNTKIEAVDASLRVEIAASRKEMREGFVGVNNRLANIGDTLEDHEKRITRIEHELAP